MSRKLFAFLLSELATVRLMCKCGVVVEMPVESLQHPNFLQCNGCKTPFTPGASSPMTGPLAELASAIRKLEAKQDQFQVEFVLPDTSGE